MNKNVKTLYLMCGIPASGKSTYARKLAEKTGAVYVSRDEVRFSLLKDGEDYFSHEDEVLNIFYSRINEALVTNGSCIADATHLSRKARFQTLNQIKCKDVKVVLIIMNTPLLVCLERNAKRTGRARVPETAIGNMYLSLKAPVGKELNYYHKIIEVDSEEDD